MTSSSRPPQEFYDWLDANYSFEDVQQWRAGHIWGGSWISDPVYQYWRQNVLTGTVQAQQRQVEAQQAQTSAQLQPELDELFKRVQVVYDATDMTNEERDKLYASESAKIYQKYTTKGPTKSYRGYSEIPQETRTELEAFTSEEDLRERIEKLNTDNDTKANIYDLLLANETDTSMAMRKAKASVVTKEQKAQTERETRAKDLTEALNYTYNNPLVKPEDLKSLVMGTEGADFLAGKTDTLLSKLVDINKKAQARGTAEEQYGQAMLGGMMNQGGGQRLQEEISPGLQQYYRPGGYTPPPVPETTPLTESFLEATTLGEGTKLRSFLESQIPGIVESTQAERERWWANMHPEPRASYMGETGRMKEEAARWKGMAETAPTSDYSSDTYWGPGGLAGIAQRAYETSMGNLAGTKPEDFGIETPETQRARLSAQDPLKKALSEKDWLSQYYRRPGTGLVSRLTPSVKW